MYIKYKNLIKTQCGIDKFNKLKKNKTLIGKLRFYVFFLIAVIRDFKN